MRYARAAAWLDSLPQDFDYAVRTLRKNPVFALVAVLTLALGIGANTAIFSVTYGILLKPLPYRDSSRILQVWTAKDRTAGFRSVFIDDRELSQIIARSRTFEQVAEYNQGRAKMTGTGIPENLYFTLVSGNFFSMLGMRPILGRPISPSDTQSGHNQVVLLGYKLWQRRFGGDPSILGKVITLELENRLEPMKEPFTVIGVLPALFPLPSSADNDLIIPLVPWENPIGS